MNNDNQPQEKLWNSSYIMLLIIGTVLNAASQMVTPLISSFAISLGAPLTIATTIASIMSVTALFLRPVSGLFSDRYNRKTIILISNALVALCLFLMMFAKTVAMLFIVRLLHGIAFSFNGVALMAFNTMFIPKSRLGEGMGWMALGTTLSQAMGAPVGLKLVEWGGYTLCFAVAGVICLIGILIIVFMPYKHEPKPQTDGKFDINNLISLRILPYAFILCLFSSGNGIVNSLMVLFGEERGIGNIALFFTVYSLSMVAIRPFAGKLVDRRGLKIILYPSILLFGIAFFLLGGAYSLWVVLVAAAIKAISQGAGAPGIQSTCLKQIGREKAGVVSSTCFIGQDIGNAVSPIISGFVVEKFGYTVLFRGFSIIFVIGAVILFYLKTKSDEKKYGIKE